MTEVPSVALPPVVVTGNLDLEEARLEIREINQYLFAKSLFDCREFDRCAAVFLPDTVLAGVLSATTKGSQRTSAFNSKGKGKEPLSERRGNLRIPNLSQKSLFLALYAKFMSGEKKKEEDSEMVMGPHDGGAVINKQLNTISRFLEAWFLKRTSETGEVVGSQGWLEFL